MDMVVDRLQSEKVIGWFQGRFEWGPRALGNRSILADPRSPKMKDIVNTKIKFREPYRPFAPSVRGNPRTCTSSCAMRRSSIRPATCST